MPACADDAAGRLATLREAMPGVATRDRRRLETALASLERASWRIDLHHLARLERDAAASRDWVESRRRSVPAIVYDDSLPVHARRADIALAIREHPVVIVSGATGSGKSTQLPKICLELGRGVQGSIAHTQPRRVAVQALANRLSAELGTSTGDLVGFQVRFVDCTGPRTLVKLMTDGVLLRELERDPLLLRYDTIIVDEAHERSLNVDFLLGVCRRLLPRRPDLRVIVTSATIETRRFVAYFGGAPVIDVEGRTYPVELRYRPLAEETDAALSLPEAVREALDELDRDSHGICGDALVFLPGEKQILETRDFLVRGRADWDVLPLYGRLAGPDQDKVFEPHARRRVVLATNVAETSLTLPGVRFVVDTGLARVSRYSARAKFQRLPIEPISQASAEQRRGRCGREGAGICIRLYAESDFLERPAFTGPEILRTNLASLVLQMAALGLGVPDEFPFLDAPDARLLNDGYRLLQELNAVDGDRRITRMGRRMATLPVDPRLARILIEAGRVGVREECLTIVAFLSIQDPRERPAEKSAAADEKHALFADERSDFVAVLNLWQASLEPARAGSRALRRWCREHFLSFVRVREWADLREQLADMVERAPAPPRRATRAALHQALLTGFLGGIGVLDVARTYLGARDTRFVIAPGTPLQKRSPHWIVAASLVETHRLYARMVAQVQPSWIESAGAHLVRRTYDEAEWDAPRGMAVARETVTLHGRTLSSGRRVNFADVDPLAARRLFVEEALLRRPPVLREAFLERNEAARAHLDRLEARLRRRDLAAGDASLAQFYLERIPVEIASTRTFERWWRQEQRSSPQRLDLPQAVLLAQPLPGFDPDEFPETLELEGNPLRLDYVFDPTSLQDGLTVEVPRPLLRALDPDRLEWLIPGWLREKVIALLRGLSKDVRRRIVPIPDAADRFLLGLARFGQGSLFEQLAAFATRAAGIVVEAGDVAAVPLPPWLRANVRVIDAAGQVLREGRALEPLRRDLRQRSSPEVRDAPVAAWERESLRRWDFGDLPAQVEMETHGVRIKAFPGLQDDGTSARLRLFDDEVRARSATRAGIVRLATLAVPQQHDLIQRRLADDREFALLTAASGLGREVFAEVADRAVAEAINLAPVLAPDPFVPTPASASVGRSGLDDLPRSSAEFDARLEAGRGKVIDRADQVSRVVRAALESARAVRAATAALPGDAFAAARDDVGQQVARLLAPDWIRSTPVPYWMQLPRYLRAAARRLERARSDAARDRRLREQVTAYEMELDRLRASIGAGAAGVEVQRLRWMIEEFRVSLFAQDLRTLEPVSVRRLDQQVQRTRRESRR